MATYRLQLNAGFTFDDAARTVPFLADLGVSHLYLSPVLQATQGSTHGYDTVDVDAVSRDLGGMDGLRALVAVAEEHGLGIVLDIVPHHMALADRRNRWWWEVLTWGQRAPHARFFDIDWHSPEVRLRSKVVLPVLDDHYGRALERGSIRLLADDETVAVVAVGDALVLPLSPTTTGQVLQELGADLGDDELVDVGWRLSDVGDAENIGPSSLDHATETVRSARSRLGVVDPERVATRDLLERISSDPDRLDALLEEQAYRLARWQVASDELDYRRFFDIASLVALHTEDPEVFEATHHLVGDLVREGAVQGLRVDHVDGLVDPAGYAERLRALAPDAWLVVEKILSREETLPAWPVDGTTGYDLAAITTPFLVDPRGEEGITAAYRELTGDHLDWSAHAVRAKHEVLPSLLGSDVARLTELLVQVCEHRRRFRDFTRSELRDALIAVAAHTDAYRSYLRWLPDGRAERAPEDLLYVRRAVTAARHAHPRFDPEIFDLLQLVLGFGLVGPAERELGERFQQLTGPATAKGEEDTAMYRACRLLALDDVGHDPGRFSVGPDAIHVWAAHAAEAWPRTMLCTSTHDMKRSEDVRARLAALSEVPDELTDVARRVVARAETKHDLDGHTAWFMLQTVVGAWPAPRARLWPALEKSYREARLRTSWIHPDAPYEASAAALLGDLLDDAVLSRAIERLAARITPAGWANGLALTTLRCTLPGIPDTYQGCDGWQLSLVDPDNRRPVDFEAHARLLRDNAGRTPAECWRADPSDGAAKQALIRELLHRRRRGRWARSAHEPVTVTGPEPVAAVAYRREDLLVVVPRFPLASAPDLDDTTVEVPPGRWRDVCSGAEVAGGTATVAALASSFPVSVLERQP